MATGKWHGGKGSEARGKASSYCIRDCRNRGDMCDDCFRFDMFEKRIINKERVDDAKR